ncbi:MAG: manganese efflux pump [Bacilli bacterium]|nr:manganese efflux pump [Bacilli bacterium]
MSTLITILLIAISLSMDAFSLALIYGILDLGRKKNIIISITTGIFHFFMPLLGSVIGTIIFKNIYASHNYLVSFLFFVIAIEMVISNLKKEKPIILDWLGVIFFGLSVSIDSFLTGIGLKAISGNIVLCSFIFMITSMFFTYIGLKIGGKVNKMLGPLSSIVAIVLFLILAGYYLFLCI